MFNSKNSSYEELRGELRGMSKRLNRLETKMEDLPQLKHIAEELQIQREEIKSNREMNVQQNLILQKISDSLESRKEENTKIINELDKGNINTTNLLRNGFIAVISMGGMYLVQLIIHVLGG